MLIALFPAAFSGLLAFISSAIANHTKYADNHQLFNRINGWAVSLIVGGIFLVVALVSYLVEWVTNSALLSLVLAIILLYIVVHFVQIKAQTYKLVPCVDKASDWGWFVGFLILSFISQYFFLIVLEFL